MARVAIIAEKDYQDMELHYPRFRLIEAGHTVEVVGTGSAKSYTGKYGYPVTADKDVYDVKAADYDGLVIPGGWAPDHLRLSKEILSLVKEMDAAKKPIACICHGGWVLVSAGILKGRTVTGYIAIKDDLVHAGANYVDKEVVVDKNLITSRKPDDLPAFMRETLAQLAAKK